MSSPNARDVAAAVLARVLDQGAFAMQTLDRALDEARATAQKSAEPSFPPSDAALTTEIVYGVLRTRVALRRRLAAAAARGLPEADIRVVCQLYVAAYQILFLDRVPHFAVVDHAVSAITKLRGPKLGGFANAVLRAVTREPIDREAALLENAPAWLLTELEASIGADETRALFVSGRGRPSVDVRARISGAGEPEWLAALPHGRHSPLCRHARGMGDLRQQPGFEPGSFTVQEEGAQVCALALGAKPGERVLDACAGHGQKASLLAEQVGPSGQLIATDVSAKKLGELRREFERLSLPLPETSVVDWTAPRPEWLAAAGTFDRVLVDAPCTGTGTLARRPEILLRLVPDDVTRTAALGTKLLRNAARVVKPSGTILYVVCSVLRGEAEAVAESVLDVLEPWAFDVSELAGVIPTGAAAFRLLPGRDGTDGYFVAQFRRRT